MLVFESRRAAEIAELIRRHGGEPISAPALREVALPENRAVGDYLEALERGEIDIVLLLTGVGLRTLIEVAAATRSRQQIAASLAAVALVARGPKPVAALRELGLAPRLTVREPNTWREILVALDAELPVRGRTVAVQEYGASNVELLEGLRQRGAAVRAVPIYRYALPEDLGPLQRAVELLMSSAVDFAVFTSATQVHHLFQVAGERGDAVRRGCERVRIASIGPLCSEALRSYGLPIAIEPQQSKLGPLIRACAAAA
ncbi:MAG TPA: uroporphyrinogen-III synthase [Terriglobales bacterium]|nr:uroporphyrinogen-III synthase [Terriglobales bacterium]